MKRLSNLNELFTHQLKDMWSAQTQFADVVEKLQSEAKSGTLEKEFGTIRTDLRNHADELERLGQSLDFDHRGNKCEAAEGLVRETKEFLAANADSDVRDAGLIANLQRMLHYNIAGFGTATAYARQLDLDDVATTLHDMLEMSRRYDEHLTTVAKKSINQKAIAG